MKRRALHVTGILGILATVAAATLVFVFYDSSPDSTIRRAWGRLAAAAGRPGSEGIVLPVVFDAQDHALSCEVAALKMALAVKDIYVSESELITAVGVDATPKHHDAGQIIWGDPNRGFVGDIDGSMPSTGYGVYAEPIARAANEWGSARAVQDITPRALAEELVAGNPVVIWAYLGDGSPYEWQTPDGKTIHAVLHEHTFTVYGYRGTVEQPSGFLLMDPIYGTRYWNTRELFDRMSKLGYSAVIVY